MSKFDQRARPHLEALLEPGEELRGVLAATRQSMFRGQLLAVGVTDRRLILQSLGRHIEPKDAPIALGPDDLAEAKVQGVNGGWWTPTSAIMDRAASRVDLRTAEGEKMKLMLMNGDGPGPLAGLGGGEGQRTGVEELCRWLARSLER